MERSNPNTETIEVRVVNRIYATDDTLLLFLENQTSVPLPTASPGSHIDIRINDDIVRQYSVITPLSSPSAYVIGVKREHRGRGGSRLLHELAVVGSNFNISAPRNNFPLHESAETTILFAGGIGITPIYSMFKRLEEAGRNTELFYWCRSPESALFRSLLETQPNATLYYPESANGDTPTVSQILRSVKSTAEMYCCGPAPMIDEFIRETRDRAEKVHVERFANSAIPMAARAFHVLLSKSGKRVRVAAEESILHAVLREGIDVPYSCEEGVCGACEVKVLEGVPAHRDAVRSPEEHNRRSSMMICCSRSVTDFLTIDV